MAPEDHYRRLVSALSEASTFEDPQRLYHLGLPSHGMCPCPLAPSLTKCLPMCVDSRALAVPGGLCSPWKEPLGSSAADTKTGFGCGFVGPSAPMSPL